MGSNQSKVIQIIPYFGKWPEYFDLYLYACSRNRMVKFLFYTDCPVPKQVYPNIEFKIISYKSYCDMVSSELKIQFSPPYAYKLCDIRPFFAKIHCEDINGFEFWSYGDLDLLHGDLGIIVNDKTLSKYDVITTQNYHLAGHFTIIRNNDYYNNLCFKIPDWETKLTFDRCLALDELDMTQIVFPTLKYPLYFYNKIIKRFYPGCFNFLMHTYNRIVGPKFYFRMCNTSPEPKEGEKWVYDVPLGKVIDDNGRELPYLHFLFFKNHPHPGHPHWNAGYYHLDSDISSYSRIEFTAHSVIGYK